MSTLTTVNGLSIVSPTPSGSGGQAINSNFVSIGTRLAAAEASLSAALATVATLTAEVAALATPTVPTLSAVVQAGHVTSGTITAGGFVGPLTGTASVATTAVVAGTASTATFATTAGTATVATSYTGTVTQSQVTGLTTALASTTNASNLSTGTVATSRLGTGTATGSTYLAGDQTYKSVASILPQPLGTTANPTFSTVTTGTVKGNGYLALDDGNGDQINWNGTSLDLGGFNLANAATIQFPTGASITDDGNGGFFAVESDTGFLFSCNNDTVTVSSLSVNGEISGTGSAYGSFVAFGQGIDMQGNDPSMINMRSIYLGSFGNYDTAYGGSIQDDGNGGVNLVSAFATLNWSSYTGSGLGTLEFPTGGNLSDDGNGGILYNGSSLGGGGGGGGFSGSEIYFNSGGSIQDDGNGGLIFNGYIGIDWLGNVNGVSSIYFSSGGALIDDGNVGVNLVSANATLNWSSNTGSGFGTLGFPTGANILDTGNGGISFNHGLNIDTAGIVSNLVLHDENGQEWELVVSTSGVVSAVISQLGE